MKAPALRLVLACVASVVLFDSPSPAQGRWKREFPGVLPAGAMPKVPPV